MTDRDTVVAELRAPGSAVAGAAKPMHVREVLADLAASGDVTPASLSVEDWSLQSGVVLPEGTAASIMDELRADRDITAG